MAPFPLIDTHCHIHRQEYDSDRVQVLERARRAGVVAIVDPATDYDSNEKVVGLARQEKDLYGAVGLHPQDAAQLNSERFKCLADLAMDPKVVAIGEIGLDTYRDPVPMDVQMETLQQMLKLSDQVKKPIILHCREADKPGEGSGSIYKTLFKLIRDSLPTPVRGVMHCFGGSLENASEAIELGLNISFAGNLTFSKAEYLREVAKETPFDRVVIETDGPFLSPQKFRGKRNEPAHLLELIQLWSQIHDLSPEDVARTTTVNAYHLFGIGPAPERGKIVYAIRNSLYINLTNSCTDRCVFCALSVDDFWKGEGPSPFVKGHHLRMKKDPTVEEVLEAAGNPSGYEEVVFCGYGEPIIRLKELLVISRKLKERGAKRIRINTNGHGNLIHRRSVAPELKGMVDELSISLNTPNAQQYLELCRPSFGLKTYDAIKDFIRESKGLGIEVSATVVAMPEVDLEACRRVAEEELGVTYRVRTYNDVG